MDELKRRSCFTATLLFKEQTGVGQSKLWLCLRCKFQLLMLEIISMPKALSLKPREQGSLGGQQNVKLLKQYEAKHAP